MTQKRAKKTEKNIKRRKALLDIRSKSLPQVRVTSKDYLAIKNKADEYGVSLTEFIRTLAIFEKVPPQTSKLDASFLVELNRIGVNLNQITHAFNAGRDSPATLKYAINELVKLMKKIDEAL